MKPSRKEGFPSSAGDGKTRESSVMSYPKEIRQSHTLKRNGSFEGGDCSYGSLSSKVVFHG
jgi:hypothetical protein